MEISPSYFTNLALLFWFTLTKGYLTYVESYVEKHHDGNIEDYRIGANFWRFFLSIIFVPYLAMAWGVEYAIRDLRTWYFG